MTFSPSKTAYSLPFSSNVELNWLSLMATNFLMSIFFSQVTNGILLRIRLAKKSKPCPSRSNTCTVCWGISSCHLLLKVAIWVRMSPLPSCMSKSTIRPLPSQAGSNLWVKSPLPSGLQHCKSVALVGFLPCPPKTSRKRPELRGICLFLFSWSSTNRGSRFHTSPFD